jgi:hypothetical protein
MCGRADEATLVRRLSGEEVSEDLPVCASLPLRLWTGTYRSLLSTEVFEE